MAKLHRRPDRGNRLELDYVDVDGRRYRILTNTSDRKIAELWLRKTEERLSQAKLGLIEKVGRIDADVVAGREKKRQSLRLEEFMAEYESRCLHDLELARNTIALNNLAMRSFIGVVGSKRLSDLTDEDVRNWKRALDAEGRSRTTLSMYHRQLRAAFNRGVKWGLSEENPFSEVEVSKGAQKEVEGKNMSYDEVRLLLKVIDESDRQFGIYVRFVTYLGARRNEVLFLRYEDIDLTNTTITIRSQKTGKTLVLPINRALKRVIDGMELKEKGYVFQTQSGGHKAKFKDQPWHEDFVTHAFKKYVRMAGLPDHHSVHSLRHTFATYLRKKGVPLDIVQRLLGHASSRTTELHYDHTAALHFRAYADLVDFEDDKSEA